MRRQKISSPYPASSQEIICPALEVKRSTLRGTRQKILVLPTGTDNVVLALSTTLGVMTVAATIWAAFYARRGYRQRHPELEQIGEQVELGSIGHEPVD
jgi:hypothetical protein